jgi:hypothetical protein
MVTRATHELTGPEISRLTYFGLVLQAYVSDADLFWDHSGGLL